MIKRLLTIVYAIALILALSYNLFATNWYCDGALTGTDNGGTSWADAWESFAEINWASLNPGDTLFISGGTDSLIYNEVLDLAGVLGTAGNQITIIAGKYSPSPSGHSGRAIIDGQDSDVRNIYLGSDGGEDSTNYVTIKGLECRGGALSAIELEALANVILIDSCYLYNFGGLAGVFARGLGQTSTCDGIDSLMIRNCRIISYDLHDGETDGIYLDACTNTFIYNNYIHIPNQDSLSHVDCIQRQWSRGKLVIVNNVLINDSVYSPQGGGMPIIVRASDFGEHDPVIIYNNYCYMGGPWMPGAFEGKVFNLHSGDQPTYEPPPTFVLHNTIISNGPKQTAADLEYFGQNNDGKGVFHNNIVSRFYSDAPNYAKAFWGVGASVAPVDADSVKNNLFYSEGEGVMFSGDFTNGSTTNNGFNWAYWTGTLGGTGVGNSDPLFINNIGYEPDQSVLRGYLQSNSPAIDAGLDAEWYIDYLNNTYNLEGDWALEWADIDGNPRDNTPTIGAYEYSAAATDTTATVSFTSVNNAELNSYHIAYGVVSGIDSTSHVYTATSDSFAVNYPFTLGLSMQSVENGDTIAISNTASGSYSTANINYVVLSGTSRSFTVTTKAAPPVTTGGIMRGSNGVLIKDSTGKIIKVAQ